MANGQREESLGADTQQSGSQTHRHLHRELAMTPARHAPGSRIAQAGHVASSAVTDGAVLIDMRVGHRTRLDQLGSRIWQALPSQPTLPALVASLRDEGTSAE